MHISQQGGDFQYAILFHVRPLKKSKNERDDSNWLFFFQAGRWWERWPMCAVSEPEEVLHVNSGQ